MPAEGRYQTLIEQSPGLYGIVVDGGAFTYLSPAASLLGLKPDELLGISVLELAHPEDEELLRHALAHGASLIEVRLKHGAGHWLPVEASISEPIDDPAIAGRIFYARDISVRQ